MVFCQTGKTVIEVSDTYPKWGVSWQIIPRVLLDSMTAGGAESKRTFDAMMTMGKIDVATIEAARRG